jgi:hypothetical protein
MNTSLFFEVYAPGMKAKLDPTYRRRLEDKRMPDRVEMLGRIARSNRQTPAPFTTIRKAYKLFER